MNKYLLLVSLLLIGCEIGDINEIENDNTQDNDNSTFYVSITGDNNNNGSSEKPWRNIQFSIDQLGDNSTLIVKAGIYNERVLFLGDEDSNILLKGDDGAIIDGAGLFPIGRQALIGITNSHNIQIENFEIRNFTTPTGFELPTIPVGILINGTSKDINITDNNIHNIKNLSTCGESSNCRSGANGILAFGNTVTAISNLNFVRNEISNCILSSSEAFTLNGNINGFKILDNYIHDNNNIGLNITGYQVNVCADCSEENNRARNGIVRNNRSINNSTNLALGAFNNNPWYESKDGSAGGFYVNGGHHILFEGNYASQNDLGFKFTSEHSRKETNDILMINNYIYNNREVGLILGGYAENRNSPGGGDANNIMVYNNSFYKNSGWGTEIYFSYRVKNTTLSNNIIYGEGDVTDNFTEKTNSQSFNITWGKNLWYAKDISNTNEIQGQSIISDPLFKNPEKGELDINISSPALNEGVTLSDINTWSNSFWKSEFTDGIIPTHGSSDINGDKRINEEIELGADEV